MGLAVQFAKLFLREYSRHRWPQKRGKDYSSGVWTREAGKILDRTARKLALFEKREELKRVDFTWYRRRQPIPVVVAEHENGWAGIFDEEIPKLLASNAELKVLICYPPPEQHDDIAKELHRTLRDSGRVGKLAEEFLLIMGHPYIAVNAEREFTVCWCHQDYVIETVNKPWFGQGQEVYWEAGDGYAYRAKVLDAGKNSVKVEVTDKAWAGKHIQVTRLEKLETARP